MQVHYVSYYVYVEFMMWGITDCKLLSCTCNSISVCRCWSFLSSETFCFGCLCQFNALVIISAKSDHIASKGCSVDAISWPRWIVFLHWSAQSSHTRSIQCYKHRLMQHRNATWALNEATTLACLSEDNAEIGRTGSWSWLCVNKCLMVAVIQLAACKMLKLTIHCERV